MSEKFPCVWSYAAVLLYLSGGVSSAQDGITIKEPTNSTASALESAPDQLKKIEAEVATALDQARAVVQSQAAAGLLTEITARNLNWTLQSVSELLSPSNPRGIEAITRMPVHNVKVAEALRAIEAAWNTAGANRRALLDISLAESLRSAREALQPTENAVDLEALRGRLERLQQAYAQESFANSGYEQRGAIGARRNFVVELQRFRAGEAQKDLKQMGQGLANLRLCGQDALSAEINRFKAAYVEPYQEALDAAKAKLNAAVVAGEDLKTLRDRLGSCAAAADALGKIQSGIEEQSKSNRMVVNYRNCLDALEKMQDGQTDTGRSLFNVGSEGLRDLAPAEVAALQKRFVQIEKQLAEKSEAETAARYVKWRKTLTEISTPEQLDQFMDELVANRPRNENTPNAKEEMSALQNLVRQLKPLLIDWKSANPTFQQSATIGYIDNLSPYAQELIALRARAERDMLVRTLKAPELGEAPLASMETKAAVEAFCNDLIKRKEWRRLLDLLEARGLSFRNDIRNGLAKALHSFLSAQNFERAELWPEAVTAYKEVLLCTDLRAPIEEAATRLKALKKSEPKAFERDPAGSNK